MSEEPKELTSELEVVTQDQLDLQDQQMKQIEDEQLAEVYSDVRQIRGDGNCFYRAVMVGIFEKLLNDNARAQQFLGVCKSWNERLLKLGFPEWTTNDFCEFFITWLTDLVNQKLTRGKVFTDLNDDHHSNYLIIFMRLITSGYLKEHCSEYEPFIESGLPMDEYCTSEIEAMWKDADHLGIIGLVNATGFKIRIEYMDQSAAPNGGWHYDIPENDAKADIVLLYRPGHYDLLYAKNA
ncbi:unnamed protein product [Caenorhabditis bovis]|uniref:ubiquitinyl hydrolase 1 n=1 Tax=Caenorhabditis bovis TaxID=2654633 RepID=A0A8S1EAL5_9PELO|nr:unnamed protein product [Caenorhabditis bovis]